MPAFSPPPPPHCNEMPWGWQNVSDILMVMDNTLVRTRNRGVLKSHLTPSLGSFVPPTSHAHFLSSSARIAKVAPLSHLRVVDGSPQPLLSSSCLAWKTWNCLRTLCFKHLIGRSEMCFPAACLLCRQGWVSW